MTFVCNEDLTEFRHAGFTINMENFKATAKVISMLNRNAGTYEQTRTTMLSCVEDLASDDDHVSVSTLGFTVARWLDYDNRKEVCFFLKPEIVANMLDL